MAPAGRLARPEAVDSLSRNFHSALCIAVQRGAKFGGALAPPEGAGGKAGPGATPHVAGIGAAQRRAWQAKLYVS